jgi:hypothetical protein
VQIFTTSSIRLVQNLLTICFNKIWIKLLAFTNPELTMDHEFEFEEIKETEAERLQRLVRTTDSVSILQYVRRRAMQRWMQRGILREDGEQCSVGCRGVFCEMKSAYVFS